MPDDPGRDGRGPGYFPLVTYPIGVDSGPVRASLRLKIPSANPSALYFALRDYHNPGGKYFQTGPKLQVDASGLLTVPQNDRVKLNLPRDVWVALEVTFQISEPAAKTFDLTVSIPHRPPQVFRNVPYLDPGFQHITNVQLISTGPPGGLFLIDDIRVSTPPTMPAHDSPTGLQR